MSTCSLKVLLYNFQLVFLIAPENIYMACGAIKKPVFPTCQSNGLHKKPYYMFGMYHPMERKQSTKS